MGDSDRDSGGGKNGNNQNGQSSLSPREQDRFLPIANVSRIMKKALPANAKISKDAKETMQECVSEFISFVTGEASDKCQKEKRKTINGDDLLWAMTTLGFEDYVEPLKVYLQRFREIEGERTGLGRPQTGGEPGEHQGDAAGFYGGGAGMQYHQHHQFLHQQNHMYGATGGGSNGGAGAASGIR
ncbi:PREDICTED: nuclear transcription factor Y subunit B-2-like isoform X2 [Camelina sativa]|uniref:Nuclear transcription factor Y subunit B-2-like isoform X2 n=1 Tax=Camelina sativa TaxID=90675 RepID=A0ABM1RGF1_CAMSA|nr:PREDICTED: nuclear transcription factor Y subunit B-2-like isoform X2 [Camelina sativa]